MERNMMAALGLNPTMPKSGMSLVGMSPLGPLAGQKKPERSRAQVVFPETSFDLPLESSDAITSGLDAKAQFEISQGLQNRSFNSEAMPFTPRSNISYSQSFQRKSYLTQR